MKDEEKRAALREAHKKYRQKVHIYPVGFDKDFYKEMKEYCKEKNISISNFIKTATKKAIKGRRNVSK